MPNTSPEKYYGHLWENWQAAVQEAQTLLITLARQRRTITYGELAASLTTISIDAGSYAMTGLLRDVHRLDMANQRPSLATLVVRRSDGRPGPGYFKGLADIEDEAFNEDYWQAEFERLCTYWASQPE